MILCVRDVNYEIMGRLRLIKELTKVHTSHTLDYVKTLTNNHRYCIRLTKNLDNFDILNKILSELESDYALYDEIQILRDKKLKELGISDSQEIIDLLMLIYELSSSYSYEEGMAKHLKWIYSLMSKEQLVEVLKKTSFDEDTIKA
jgi:hypothetical protein